MSRRVLLGSGVALAGAAGYYLYNAGGDPKVAEKSFEREFVKWIQAQDRQIDALQMTPRRLVRRSKARRSLAKKPRKQVKNGHRELARSSIAP